MKTTPRPGKRIYRGTLRVRVVARAPDGTATNGAVLRSPVWICQETTATGRDLPCRTTRIQERAPVRAWREVPNV